MHLSARRSRAAGMVAVALASVTGLVGWGATSTLQSVRLVVPPNQPAAPTEAAKPSSSQSIISYGGNYYGWASSNWSGYAVQPAKRSSFNSVSGTWTVPAAAPSRQATYSAAWVGIDGFNNSQLIQTGTEQDYYNGAAHYNVWWATNENGFVEGSFSTAIAVTAGDVMQATIDETGDNVWAITLEDVSTGATATQSSISHTGSGSSAEWIVEDPALSVNGVSFHLATLASYGTSVFDNGKVNNQAVDLVATSTRSDAGLMVQHSHVVSVPSTPDTGSPAGDGFAISYGPVPPAAPGS